MKKFKEKWDPEAAHDPRLLQSASGLECIMGGSHTVEGDFNYLKHEKSVTRTALANLALEEQLHFKQQLYLKKSNQTMSEVVASLAELTIAELIEDEKGGAGDSDDE